MYNFIFVEPTLHNLFYMIILIKSYDMIYETTDEK